MSEPSRLYGRTLARCQALQLLFQAETCGRSVPDVLEGDYVLSKGPLSEYGEQLARGVAEHETELDHVLGAYARNWSISRMSGVDRNLLRLALYEMLYVDEVEAAVSISECVELAKMFGSTDVSSRFVNGVLGRIAADIEAGVDVVEKGRQSAAEEAAEFERKRAEREAAERERAEREAAARAAAGYDDDYGYGDGYGYRDDDYGYRDGYGDRGYDDRGYDDRGYGDNSGYDDRGYGNDRGYGDDHGYGDGHPYGYGDDRGYDDDGYGERRSYGYGDDARPSTDDAPAEGDN